MTTTFRSPWMDWQGSETLPCSTDKTDKSPSVSFVSSTGSGFRQESERVHCVVLLGKPYPDEPNNGDPSEGRIIIEAVQAAGGWLAFEHGKIVLRWRGLMPSAGKLIDQIRAARTAVVLAMGQSSTNRSRP